MIYHHRHVGQRSVIVIGSGAAGLTAALAAHEAGADVTVIEATSTIGGSTALSGGAVWAPNNHVKSPASERDSFELGRTYLKSLAIGDVDIDLINRYLEEVPRTLQWLESSTQLRMGTVPCPDCHGELPGGMTVAGRTLEPLPLKLSPEVKNLMRPPLPWRPNATLTEMMTNNISKSTLEERRENGIVTLGQALIGSLLTSVLASGIHVKTSTRVTKLTDGGVQVDGEHIKGRVILATGGFERNTELANTFLRFPNNSVLGAPIAHGDGLRIAMGAGAALGNMSEAWWCPTIEIPGDEIDGEIVHRMLFVERARPGSIMVDSLGRRFCDEAQNYNDIGRSLHSFESARYTFERASTWLIFDSNYRNKYSIATAHPGQPSPAWLITADTIEELAKLIGVPGSTLFQTISRFNLGAEKGNDPDFGRGSKAFDLAIGDPLATHPTLGALTNAPYFAARVHPGLGGTKGGPRIDVHGRVQHINGGSVPGLYAAGNVAANPFGFAYPGMGATIGPALTFGAIAGRTAATD